MYSAISSLPNVKYTPPAVLFFGLYCGAMPFFLIPGIILIYNTYVRTHFESNRWKARMTCQGSAKTLVVYSELNSIDYFHYSVDAGCKRLCYAVDFC